MYFCTLHWPGFAIAQLNPNWTCKDKVCCTGAEPWGGGGSHTPKTRRCRRYYQTSKTPQMEITLLRYCLALPMPSKPHPKGYCGRWHCHCPTSQGAHSRSGHGWRPLWKSNPHIMKLSKAQRRVRMSNRSMKWRMQNQSGRSLLVWPTFSEVFAVIW